MTKTGHCLLSKIVLLVFVAISFISGNYVSTGGQQGLTRTVVTETLNKTGWSTGMALKYDFSSDYVAGPFGEVKAYDEITGDSLGSALGQLYSGDIFFAYGLARDVDISVALPFYHDRLGLGLTKSAMGNPELTIKFTYPSQEKNLVFSQSYFLRVLAPAFGGGEQYLPRNRYLVWNKENVDTYPEKFKYDEYYTHGFGVQPMLVWTIYGDRLFVPIPFQFHGNLGMTVSTSGAFIGAFAMEYLELDPWFFFGELYGESLARYYFEFFRLEGINNDFLMLSGGFKRKFKNGLIFQSTFDWFMTDKNFRSDFYHEGIQYSTRGGPRFGVHIALKWQGLLEEQDSDGDGIVNKDDKCQKQMEDIDGFQDKDGCPDYDNDNDGIPDIKDKCPNIPVVCSGCIEVDNDNDGIFSTSDKCPDKAEDFDGFEDKDGCPEADNDYDGIPDEKDACSMLAEDRDGFQDADGCPDPDNDHDSIPDKRDECPNQQGDKNNKGCPGDVDGDGVPFNLDNCPSEKGPETNFGCPMTDFEKALEEDRDGDSIPDAEDECPDLKGDIRHEGCLATDEDNDGILDYRDKCPSVKGDAIYDGCLPPDGDDDGVSDEDDECPKLKGLVEFDGCLSDEGDSVLAENVQDTVQADSDSVKSEPAKPEPPERASEPETDSTAVSSEVPEPVQPASFFFRQSHFKSGSDELKPEAYIALQRIYERIMKDVSERNVLITSYPDKLGRLNKELLLTRAEAVKKYFVNLGLSAERIMTAAALTPKAGHHEKIEFNYTKK